MCFSYLSSCMKLPERAAKGREGLCWADVGMLSIMAGGAAAAGC